VSLKVFFSRRLTRGKQDLEIEGLSAHADQKRATPTGFHQKTKPKKKYFPWFYRRINRQMNFCIKIYEHYGFDCSVPLMGQEFEF
jgi:metallo-beta-lactamase family protein